MKITLVFFLFTSLVLAQSNGILSGMGGKAYISINTGPSFPLGDFGDKNPQNEKSGFAKTGYFVELNGGIRLFNILEFSIVGFRNENGTDLDNLINNFNQSNPGTNFSGSSDSWVIYGALGGLGVSYPLGYGYFGDFRFLGGYLNSTSPEINLQTTLFDTYAKIESSTTSSFVYYFSGSVRRPLTDRIHASFGFQYLGGGANFDNVKTITSINGQINESTTSFQRGMNVWGLTLGLRFILF